MSFVGWIKVFCDYAIDLENIENEYFVFDPQNSRYISGLSSGSSTCHLSIH